LDVCSISQSRNAQSIGQNPIVPDIATRNSRLSKLPAQARETGPAPGSLPVHLWQQNNNFGQSPFEDDHDRLTLPENWGQIGIGRRVFLSFLSRRAPFGKCIDVLLTAAFAG
jgi:hypothetical protein